MWHVERNHVKILKSAKDRKRTTPSVVRFDPASEHAYEVGHAAIAQETQPVGNTVRSIKRLMGQKYASKAVEVAKSFGTYTVASTKQGNAAVQVVRNEKPALLQPEEVSACILSDLKASAEAYFDGKRIDNVVITVPAYFSDSQRKATITSASMAGFKVIRLMNEPTAAAMAYGLFVAGTKIVVVFDFGGGTLDVSLMSIQDGRFEVLGIGGDTNLGGEDLNNVIIDHLSELLHKHHDVARSRLTMNDMIQLKTQAERAKIELSNEDTAKIRLRDVAGIPAFEYTLTRHKFEQLCESIWKKCVNAMLWPSSCSFLNRRHSL
jgi:molecular chaperone DnaK (HSP70)